MKSELRFYLAENPNTEPMDKEFVPPTREEYEQYKEEMNGYEPGKAIQTYEAYVERLRQDHESLYMPLKVFKVLIESEEDMDKIEKEKGFRKWIPQRGES